MEYEVGKNFEKLFEHTANHDIDIKIITMFMEKQNKKLYEQCIEEVKKELRKEK